ncbi:MAG: hypothetical protein J0I98_10585 [Mesorhizobium sp.]|nr:hypothetical protein [Mesorhizobium sp.]MBN9270410.1 hypothetical protein [Mesorhizobium sp.]
MPNFADRWPAAPDWTAARIEGAGFTVRTLTGLHQLLVSGDLDAWNAASGLSGSGVGALALAKGKAWQARVARDRLLAVSEMPFKVEPGWHGEGFAVTRMDAALHVFEIEGEGLDGIVARATTLDPAAKSPSASVLFAGVNAVVYRHGTANRLRVHVDRGLAAYLWEWFGQAVGRPGR